MKALFAAFAVAVAAGFAAATPASAQTVDKQCLVLDYSNNVYNLCTCSPEFGTIDPSVKDRLGRPTSLQACSGLSVSLKSSSGGGKEPHGHGKSFSKASSTSKVVGIAVGGNRLFPPFAFNKNSENTKSFATGNGEAAAGAGASGTAIGADVSGSSFGVNGGLTYGDTSGSSCAGSGCNGNPNVGNP